MLTYRRISVLLGIVIVVAMLLAACGTRPAPTPTTAVQPPAEEPVEEPAPGEKDLLDLVMESGKLVVSTDPNYAPQSFLNDKGELDGFDVEVAKEVARRLGVTVEFTTPDWDLITGGNWGGRWDVSIGSMTPTEPRAEILWFTDPYYYVPASFAVHRDNVSIRSVNDLSGKSVGLGTATTYEAYLDRTLAIMGGQVMYDPPAGVMVKPYSTDAEAIQDLALGDGVRLDAVMSAQPTIQEAMDQGLPLKYVGTPAFYEPLAFSLDKARGPSSKMLTKLNSIIADMHGDGRLTELSLKWYGIDITALTTPEEAAPPAEPQTLTIASGTDVENFNIRRVTSSPSFSVVEHIYEPLFYMTPDGDLEPLLAESIEPGEDEYSFVIKLRQGIRFTDGEPFNAQAVKTNLDWILETDPAPVFAFLINRIQEVVVVDEYAVQLNLESDFAPLGAHLSHGAIAMVSPALLARGEDAMTSTAIGTGPYVLQNWTPDEAVTLTRNDAYWGDKPAIDTVIFRVIKEDGARIVEIEAGTVDVAVRIPPAEAARLAANPNINIDETPGLRTIYIFFNVTNEPFTDVRVRQAVNYAVDVEGIVRDLFEGAARVSDAPIAPRVFGYSAQPTYARDVELARRLLREAGVAEGTTVTLFHPTGRYIQDALVADAVRSQLREVGLNVELRTLEWPQYVPHVRRPAPENDIQFAMLGWGTVTMDADYGLFALFHSSEHPPGFNGSFYDNPEVDRLLDEARVVVDPEERRRLYDEAISIIWEDAPWLFLYSEVQLTAIRANVDGFIVHPDESLIATQASKR